jgi:rRNA processing protein Gar1
MAASGRGGKRRHNDDDDDDEVVDDLAVASMFAAATASAAPIIPSFNLQQEVTRANDEVADEEEEEESSNDDSDDDDESDESDDEDSQADIDEIKLDDVVGDDTTSAADGMTTTNKNDICADVGRGMTDIAKTDDSTAPILINDGVDDDKEGDDDDSDIDLTEHLANMVDDDEYEDNDGLSAMRNKRGKGGGRNPSNNKNRTQNDAAGAAPRTENEIDLYNCPTEELQKLNVLDDIIVENCGEVSSTIAPTTLSATSTATTLNLDDSLKAKLRIAGTVRSYLACQRTIVIDSFIPPSLSGGGGGVGNGAPLRYSFHGASVSQPLDIGSMLVIITKEEFLGGSKNDGTGEKCTATAMHEIVDDDNNNENGKTTQYTVQILGKIMEIFGPVQRPFYAIRLPDPPRPPPPPPPPSKIVKEELVDDERSEKQQQLDAANNFNEVNDPSCEVAKKVDEDEDTHKAEQPDVRDVNADIAIVALTNGKSRSSQNETSVDQDGEVNQPATEKVDVEGKVHDESTSTAVAIKDITDGATTQKMDDPWSSDGGKLSTMLLSTPNAAVYSLSDYSKLVDTANVIRISGKGCDASNMYDEEVGMDEQQYFSDDEQEREAKRRGGGGGAARKKEANDDGRGASFTEGRGRGGGSGRGSGRDGRGRGRGRGRGGHSFPGNTGSFGSMQTIQQPSHQQPYLSSHQQQRGIMQTTMMGSGSSPYSYAGHGQPHPSFHQGMYHQQQYLQPQYSQQQFQHQQPQQYQSGGLYHQYHPPQGHTNMVHGAPPPPPPPPRLGNITTNPSLPPYYQSTPAQHVYQLSSQPPPPPPHPGAAESDTVYYDYSGS